MTDLPRVKKGGKKRVGRGYGSGKGGHTTGRGVKGQKSRAKLGILFEGVKVRKSLLNRLPQLRGKGKFKSRKETITLNLDDLNKLPSGSRVTEETLIKSGLIKEKEKGKKIKVLGSGKLEKRLNIFLPTTTGAMKKIMAKGGKVESK